MPTRYYNMASSSSSSDVTMTTLSGQTDSSERSRSEVQGYRPVRGRSESANFPRRALPAAPYDNHQLKAIMDAERDIESGLESDDASNVGIGALMAYRARVNKNSQMQATAIADRDRQIQELQQQLAQANSDRKLWVERCEQSIVSADKMEEQIDKLGETHVSREHANTVLNYAVEKSRDLERQATVREATNEHNQIMQGLKTQAVTEHNAIVENLKNEAQQNVQNAVSQVQSIAEQHHKQIIVQTNQSAEQAINLTKGQYEQLLEIERCNAKEAQEFAIQEMRAREEAERKLSQVQEQQATAALKETRVLYEAAKSESETSKAALAAFATKLPEEKSDMVALAKIFEALTGEIRSVREDGDIRLNTTTKQLTEGIANISTELVGQVAKFKSENDGLKKQLDTVTSSISTLTDKMSVLTLKSTSKTKTVAGSPSGGPDGSDSSDSGDERKDKKKEDKDPPRKAPKPKGSGGGGDPDDDPDDDDDGDGDDEESVLGSITGDGSASEFEKLIKKLSNSEKDVLAKEDAIKLNGLPNDAGEFRIWKNTCRTIVASATKEPEAAATWFDKIKDATFEDLSKSGKKFLRLDLKIAADITKHAKGALAKRIQLAAEKVASSGGIIKGRQLLKMVYEHYKTNADYGHVYDINDLGAVKMSDPKNNNQLLGFIDEWDNVLLGAVDKDGLPTIRERDLELMLYDRIQYVPWIQYDIERYKRAERGDPIKNYKFLYDAVDRTLSEHNQIRNRQDIAKKRGGKPAAAPAPQRHKSKSRGRSAGNREANTRGKSRDGNGRGRSKGRHGSQPSRGRSSSRKSNDNICISWKKNGHCPRGGKNGKCKYEHPEEKRGSSKGRKSRSRSGSNKSRKGSPATPGPADKKKSKSKSPSSGKICWKGADCEFHKQGRCHFLHADAAAPATKKKNRRNKSKGKSGNV